MSAPKQRWAETLGAHERAHVRIIKQVLGPKAGPRPSFDFGDANETDAAFTKTAVAMEDLTVALLTGVTPQVNDRGLTAALMGLLTVEARHAAWARNIVNETPAPHAFDEPRTLRSVRGTIARTRFVVLPAADRVASRTRLHRVTARRAAVRARARRAPHGHRRACVAGSDPPARAPRPQPACRRRVDARLHARAPATRSAPRPT